MARLQPITIAEEELRLAWQAQRDGRPGARDLLLTLAVADASTDETWVHRCRSSLIARRPDNLFAAFPSRERALADPRVRERLVRARRIYPRARVRWQLLRSAALCGPYSGTLVPLEEVLNDLFPVEPASRPPGRDPGHSRRPSLGTVGRGQPSAPTPATATAHFGTLTSRPADDPLVPILLTLLAAASMVLAASTAQDGTTRAA